MAELTEDSTIASVPIASFSFVPPPRPPKALLQPSGLSTSSEVAYSAQIPGFYRGMLRAIRPHLAGAVAEAADRVLASVEEADNKKRSLTQISAGEHQGAAFGPPLLFGALRSG